MFRRISAAREARRYRRRVKSLPKDLSPHILCDIGFDPGPARKPIRWPQLW